MEEYYNQLRNENRHNYNYNYNYVKNHMIGSALHEGQLAAGEGSSGFPHHRRPSLPQPDYPADHGLSLTSSTSHQTLVLGGKAEEHTSGHPTATAAPLVDHLGIGITPCRRSSLHQQHQIRGGDEGRDCAAFACSAGGGCNEDESMKRKIIGHPLFYNLLESYLDCLKVGAPAEVVSRLTAVSEEFAERRNNRSSPPCTEDTSNHPDLDQFMEAYCKVLGKYREEVARPLQEAMDFVRIMESQLNLITHGGARIFTSEDRSEVAASSEVRQEKSGRNTELGYQIIDHRAEDRQIKSHLSSTYISFLSSLHQELSKRKKNVKLPKEARQKLLSWWQLHHKWPYPSEMDKVALTESTGLDRRQIDNWFINQRKRHWKPSEMKFMMMDEICPNST